jgi:succinate dehydrogenase subunit C
MTVRKPYVRPMTGWWRKNPFFVRYMMREVTAPFVAIYALILLVGLVRLAQGEGAYNAWLSALTHPVSIVIHLALLVAIIYHSVTLFKVMPKTMPRLSIAGRALPENTVSICGWLATVVVSIVVFLLVRHP